MDDEPRWETLQQGSPASSTSGTAPGHGTPAKRPAGSPAKFTPCGGPFRCTALTKETEVLVVSDSEEERQRRVKAKRVVLASIDVNDLPVIEISDSEDEDASNASVLAQKGDSQNVPGPSQNSMGPPTHGTPKAARTLGQTPRARRIIASSESEDEGEVVESAANDDAPPATPAVCRRRLPLDDDIIDLTESSPEPEPRRPPEFKVVGSTLDSSKSKGNPKERGKGTSTTTNLAAEEAENIIPLFLDDNSDEEGGNVPDDPFALEDGSILVLNEPQSARKPVRRTPTSSRGNASNPFTPIRQSQIPERADGKDAPSEDEEDLDPVKPQAKPHPTLVSNARTAFPSPGPSKRTPGTGRAPRMTKKMLQEQEFERRRTYAATFFRELNTTVFGGGIPETTELVWSKRLLTTAGKAHWKRDRNGVHETSIELAEKVLDCDERIRNTLSHEMCHLASWIISNAAQEQHGPIFKGWARRVEQKRPEVKVTTRHDYEINHKYQWKCEDCTKTYGRHSKSIDPEEHACGVCQGRLVPQFKTRQRAPKTPKPSADSQNAATRSRDSPLVMPGAFPATPAIRKKTDHVHEEADGSDDSDVEILAHTFKGVQISGTTRA